MPCTSAFERQDATYRDRVLPPAVTSRVAIEAGVPDAWWRYVGSRGRVLGMTTFGASAPAKDLFRHFGFTAEAAASAMRGLLPAGAQHS
jgi:transketolase